MTCVLYSTLSGSESCYQELTWCCHGDLFMILLISHFIPNMKWLDSRSTHCKFKTLTCSQVQARKHIGVQEEGVGGGISRGWDPGEIGKKIRTFCTICCNWKNTQRQEPWKGTGTGSTLYRKWMFDPPAHPPLYCNEF